MQEFWTFNKKVHELAKCKDEECATDNFLTKIKDTLFNEELSYDNRRIFFTRACLDHLSVFNAMFQLHHKGKEDMNRIESLIENLSEILQ